MVSRRDPRPPYIQVADELRAAITSGAIAAGEKLPSSREIQDRFGVGSRTAQDAVKLLKEEGLVEGRPGAGVFVREQRPMIGISASYIAPSEDGGWASWRSEAAKLGMVGAQRLGDVGVIEAPDEVALALRLEPRAQVVRRERTMLLDTVPVQLVTSYYPLSIAQGTALAEPAKIPRGAPALLAELGFPPVDCTEVVTARMPTQAEGDLFDLARGVPVLRIVRTTSSTGGEPVEVCVLVLAADRHRLVYQLPIHGI